MTEIDTNHRPNKKNTHPVESPASLPAWLLRYRRALIMLAHITAFASSLMLSFLVIHNMNFEKPGWVDIYPTLLLFFLFVISLSIIIDHLLSGKMHYNLPI